MDDSLNDTHEDKLDTSRSSTSDEATHSPRPKGPFALHIDSENKENDKGESKPSTPKTGQNKNVTKKPQTPTESTQHHALRAPYAQPVLDASKKSTVEERLAVAKERRIQQQKQLVLGWNEDRPELEFKSRLEKGDQAYAKFIQTKEDKRRQIEENRARDDQHRKEVEMRKKQMEEEEKKKAEAKVARTEQVYEVKMRQKRSTSTDRAMKRWSWGAGADGDEGQKSASQTNLSSPSLMKPSADRFSKSPLLINSPHMAFASGLRSYDSGGKGTSPGRPATTSGLTEPVTISPRLLAPTRASLARSRNAINEIDDSASQSSNDSRSHGPMRSRSKDRRSPASTRPHTSPRVDSAKVGASKAIVDKNITPTRSSSSTVPNRRPPSPAKLATSTASSDAKRTTPIRSTSAELSKPKRGTSPQPRPLRAPSPASRQKQADASHTTPTRTTPKRQPSPSPASSRAKQKTQNESPKPASTPPNIKQSLRPTSANQIKAKTSSAKSATAKPTAVKNKSDNPKPIQKTEKPAEKKQSSEKSDSGYQGEPKLQQEKKEPTSSTSRPALSTSATSGVLSKSASDTSQDVSDIPKLEPEKEDVKIDEPAEESQTAETVPPAVSSSQPALQEEEKAAKETEKLPENDTSASTEQAEEPEQPEHAPPQIPEQNKDVESDVETAPETPVDATKPSVSEDAGKETPSVQSQDEPVATAKPETEAEKDDDVLQEVGDISEDIQPDSLTSFQTVEPVDPRAVSPADSLEEIRPEQEEIPQSQNLRAELGDESLDVPQPDSFDEESDEDLPSVKENKPEIKEDVEKAADPHEAHDEHVASEEKSEDGAGEQVTVETVEKEEEKTVMTQDDVSEVSQPAAAEEEASTKEAFNSQVAEDTEPEVNNAQETAVDETSGKTEPLQEPESAPAPEMVKDEVKVEEKSRNDEKEQTQSNGETSQTSERKTQPRKNLETDEEKEAYRQAIAEKRRELKEKKEQEERERQERIRLAKVEQAKREEEARRMFEEAAAAAEREKELEEEREKMREEEERKQQEEEKRKEEEANARKREAAEKVRRDRELQKQKQEDERMARKKRLEMIMRRTRQPDAADSSKPKNDDLASPLGTPSPQQSPASGRSPQTQSPVGGISPLTAGTPERSVSPAVAAVLNRSSDSLSTLQASEEHKETSAVVNSSTSEPNLLNFTNSATKYDQSGVELIKIDAVENPLQPPDEKPVPFEAFTQKNILNGVEDDSQNHNGSNNMDPFGLFTNGSQPQQETNVPVNGNQDLLNLATDVLQQKVPTEPLVPTGI